MRKSDPIRHLMYESASRQKVMTAEQEQSLARKLREAKYEMWHALLADPLTVRASLEFIGAAAERQAKRKQEFDPSSFKSFEAAARRFHRRPIRANESQLRRRRGCSVESLVIFDPCMEIALALFHQAKAWQDDQPPARAATTYAEHLKEIESAWNRYVSLRNHFAKRNIRLVMMISNRFTGLGIPQEDLIQEGTFGLQKAVGMFDPDRGFKFSTYSTWWIRASISRYCRDNARIIRIPVNTQEQLERYHATVKRLEAANEEFDTQKISDLTAIAPGTILRLQKITADKCYSTELEYKNGLRLGDLLVDPDDRIEAVNKSLDLEWIRKVIPLLPARQQYIVKARFGLDGGEGETLQEIADVFKVSRERIRQLEAKALNLIRYHIETRNDKIAAEDD